MAQAARKLDARQDRREWLSVEAAAEVTGDSVRTWQRRAALEAESARRQGRESLATKRKDGTGRLVWHVSTTLDSRLTPSKDGSSADGERPRLLTKYPAHAVERAYRKLYWLKAWRRRCARNRDPQRTELDIAAEIVAEAKRIEGKDLPISVRSLQMWRRNADEKSSDGGRKIGVEGLLDRRSLSTNTDGDVATATRSPEAVEYFYSLYHTQSQHSVKACHDATLAAASCEGWLWPGSYASAVRWLDTHDRLDETCLHRDPRKYRKKYMPHIERDWSAIAPGDTYILDHAQLDLWCEADQVQVRAWLTAAIDGRSRCLVGWHIGYAPHQDTIMAALRMAFREWALPHRVYIDRGKDFCSELLLGVTKTEARRLRRELGPNWRETMRHEGRVRWAGVLGELGIDVTEAIPYQPWSKALVERFFGRVHDQFDKTFSTYCGSDVLSRPECVEAIRRGYTGREKCALKKRYGDKWQAHAVLKVVDQSDVPSINQVRERFGNWLLGYHNEAHRGNGVDGATPLSVWKTADSLRRAQDDELVSLMQARGVYRVGPNGVAFLVAGRRCSYGAGSVPLRRHVGRDVFITLDPDDCSHCCAYTADPDHRMFIATLMSNERLPANTPVEQLRTAMKRLGRRRRLMRRANAEAPQRTRSASQELAAMQTDRAQQLRKTGTDDRDETAPRIVPVATGFEGVSRPGRSGVDVAPYEPPDPSELECLFDDDPIVADTDDDDMEGMEALFDDDVPTDGEDDVDEMESIL